MRIGLSLHTYCPEGRTIVPKILEGPATAIAAIIASVVLVSCSTDGQPDAESTGCAKGPPPLGVGRNWHDKDVSQHLCH